MRDKMIELIHRFFGVDSAYFGIDAAELVDYLIAHNITLNEWIKVEDHLPKTDVLIKRGGGRVVPKSVRVLCACKQRSGNRFVKEGYCEIWNEDYDPYWSIPGTIDEVTHWMTMPELPEEDQLMFFIVCLCSAILGGFLNRLGFSPSDWQFWTIGAIYMFPNICWLIRDSKE